MWSTQICEGDSVQVGNGFYKTAGVHEIILQNVNTCDSLVVLDLGFITYPIANLEEEICDGSSFEIGTETFSSAGNYQVTLTSSEGCDSLVALALAVVQTLRDSIQQDICNGQTYKYLEFMMVMEEADAQSTSKITYITIS